METLLQDLRISLRMLRTNPVFTVIAVGTLALGIGTTTAMFGVVNASLIRPLPFAESDRLAMVYLTRSAGDDRDRTRWSYPEFEMLRSSSTAFEDLAAWTIGDFNLAGDPEPEHVEGEVVSAQYFDLLRLRPVVGRGFDSRDDAASVASPVVAIGHALWMRRFGGDSSVVGRAIRVNRMPLTVVGVIPAGFRGLSGRAELWVPQGMGPVVGFPGHLTDLQHFHNVVARLAPDRTVDDVLAELEVVGARLDEEFVHEGPARWGATAIPLNEARVDPSSRRAQLILFGAVTFVLLISCANVANLLIGRGATRQREIAIRLAIGSGRRRLVRQLVTESLVLALIGGVMGTMLALWITDALTPLVPSRLPSPSNDYAQLSEFATLRFDATILFFALTTSLVTGILFGLAPALRASRFDLTKALRQSPGERSGRPAAVSGLLIIAEFGLSGVLLVGAALLLVTYAKLEGRDVGFDPEHVTTFWIQPAWGQYDSEAASAFLEEVVTTVSEIPGVDAATVGLCTPMMSACARTIVQVVGEPDVGPGAPSVGRHYVAPDHFDVLGMRLLRGRGITSQDRRGRPRITVINETAARRFWPGQDPIGARVWFGVDRAGDPDSAYEVVGVVNDAHYGAADDPPRPDFYTSYLQFTWPFTFVMVRSAERQDVLVPALRRAVREIDSELPIYDLQPLSDRVGAALSRARFNAVILGSFAALAVLLAAIGIYGVMTQFVLQRRFEMGLRMALGAEGSDVRRLILGRGARFALIGVIVGSAGAFATTRLLTSILYGVEPTDPVVLLAVAVLLVSVALVAVYAPARRATRVDPMRVLKTE